MCDTTHMIKDVEVICSYVCMHERVRVCMCVREVLEQFEVIHVHGDTHIRTRGAGTHTLPARKGQV